jgi:hypothetical protein
VTSIRANTECAGSCRIGAMAPMSDTLAACWESRVHGTLVMRSDQRRLARHEVCAARAGSGSRRFAVRSGSGGAGQRTRPGRAFYC